MSRKATPTQRISSALVAVASLALILTAASLSPASQGHDTHTQLGLSSCSWPILYEAPCPTCGMTTAFAHAADISPLQSLKSQPFGAMLALATAAAFWICLHTALTGSLAAPTALSQFSPRSLYFILGLALAAWVYKIVVF